MRDARTRIAIIGIASLIAMLGALAAQEPPARPAADDVARQRRVLSPAMASKLRHAQELVGALAVEDFARLADSARALRAITQDTLWKVSPNLKYVKYSAEFATAADELARRAKENDLDGATLSYVRMTISCVECHRLVRDNHILGEMP